jgi:prepilin-type N-terminal cleavage/methylation domain-containing protein/prepilin-type processing-associated H-X9-DG protein
VENMKKKFTLIELLVVITILGILLTLLLPSLRAAKENTKTVVCLSNLRQIGVSFSMFSKDESGEIPPWCEANNTATFVAYGNPSYMWDENIAPYLGIEIKNAQVGSAKPKTDITGNISVMMCTSDDVVRTSSSYYPSTYAYNRIGLSYFEKVFVATFDKPAEVIAISESPFDTHYFAYATNSDVTPQKQRTNYLGMHRPNVSGERYNYLFVDGHVATVPIFSTLGSGTLTSPKGLWTKSTVD